MPTSVGRLEVVKLLDEGAQAVEVLPREEYDWAHIAGAIHLPLKQFSAEAAGKALDRSRPVIVYCHDTA